MGVSFNLNIESGVSHRQKSSLSSSHSWKVTESQRELLPARFIPNLPLCQSESSFERFVLISIFRLWVSLSGAVGAIRVINIDVGHLQIDKTE